VSVAPSLKYDDEESYDLMKTMSGPSMGSLDVPEYPTGCQFSVSQADLERAGLSDTAPNDSVRFSAMGVVTSVFRGREDCRVELELTELAGPDGQFADLDNPAHICLCGPELEKMGLEADCERGDTIHLIGRARVESRYDSEWAGDVCTLQITEMKYEDESSESREGE
jgi:hypothetical protein